MSVIGIFGQPTVVSGSQIWNERRLVRPEKNPPGALSA
jgi:hypothetical protein